MKLILGTTCKTRHLVCKNVLRLAGELSIVRVLNDFQPLLILLVN
ncbi:capsid protein [Escherichia coli]|nr:capsid protein [Escherichia coli]TWQ14456.1 capsid protein [Escherichia coli]